MDIIQAFNRKPENKNWLKCNFVLECIRKYLETWIDEEVKVFHQQMSQQCGSDPCGNNCDFSKWKPKDQPIPLLDCEVCSTWRDVILSYHCNQRGKVMWKNSKPHLWSQDKWEVAKVYMPNGHKDHHSVGDFDIAAFLCLMTQCTYFKKFELGTLCAKVSNVRNNIMHSPNYQLKQEDLYNYVEPIRKVGEVLAKDHPDYERLCQDIDEIQRLDFILTLPAQELEQKLVAALEENQKIQQELKQVRSDHEKEIEALHRSYGEKAAEQEVTQDIGVTIKMIGERFEQGFLAVKQEASASFLMTIRKFLKNPAVKQEASASFGMKMRDFVRDHAHASLWMKTKKIPVEEAQLEN